MSELKPCPFCGSEAYHSCSICDRTGMHDYSCSKWDCPLSKVKIDEIKWQSRPLEDALKVELARLQSINERLIEDGDRLAKSYEIVIVDEEYGETYCIHCHKTMDNLIIGKSGHTQSCPITLHRALMEEAKK